LIALKMMKQPAACINEIYQDNGQP